MVAAAISRRTEPVNLRRLAIGAFGTVGVLAVLSGALMIVRVLQAGSVARLLASYRELSLEPLAIGSIDGSFIPVDWTGAERGSSWQRRASDLLVVALDGARCGQSARLTIKTRYRADTPSHDLSSEISVGPEANLEGARIFIPIFRAAIHDQELLRFSGLEMLGAPANCVASVARATTADHLPLWIQFVDAPGSAPFYETMRLPRLLSR